MRAWKALFRAIGIVATGFLLAMILRPPKLDEAIKYNSPRLYIPVFIVIFVLWVVIIWRDTRKP